MIEPVAASINWAGWGGVIATILSATAAIFAAVHVVRGGQRSLQHQLEDNHEQLILEHQHNRALQKSEFEHSIRLQLFEKVTKKYMIAAETASKFIGKYQVYIHLGTLPGQATWITDRKQLSDSLIDFIFEVENHMIISPKFIDAFSLILESYVYDINQLPPQHCSIGCSKFIDTINFHRSFLTDFQKELQHLTYGELFKNELQPRLPRDHSLLVLENNEASLLKIIDYFSNKSAWGKFMKETENWTKEKYSFSNNLHKLSRIGD